MRLLWCRGFPAFPGDRRGKPWGKGTQATPLLSNGESKEGSDTYFIKWHDFRRLHSTGEDLFYYCCFETRRVTELGVWEVGDIVCLQLLAAASVWLQPLARPKKASFDLSRLFCSLGDVCVCTLFFLPLFFLFTWQGLRQMLLNILFQWEWGTRVAVGVCCLPRWRHASAVLLSPCLHPFVLPSYRGVSGWHKFCLVFEWLEQSVKWYFVAVWGWCSEVKPCNQNRWC